MALRGLAGLVFATSLVLGAGSPAAHAQPQLGNLVGILAATPESSWVKVNQNPFSAAWVPEELQVLPYAGPFAPRALILAWSSFAWDSNRGDLILFGGGHANYGGNEVIRWRGTTQLWQRASVPSEVQYLGNFTYEAIDGAMNAPVSAHTYDNQLFLPLLDRFLTFGGAAFDTGGRQPIELGDGSIRSTGPFLWDPARGDPNKVGGLTGSHVQRVAPHPEITGGQMWQNLDIYNGRFAASLLPTGFVNTVSDVVVENGLDTVYISGRVGAGTNQDLFRLQIPSLANRALDVWQRVGIFWSAPANQGAGSIDPIRKVFLRTGPGAPYYFSYWNLNTPGPSNIDVNVTGIVDATGTFAINQNYGMDFDRTRSRFLLWGGGGTVWSVVVPATLGPTGWVVTRQPAPVGSVPPTDVGTGVLGKFKYIPNLDAFMALDTVGDVWLYKPVGWVSPGGNAPPTVSITSPANGAAFTAPASVVVDATASDSDGSINRVEFYRNGALVATDNAAPYTTTMNLGVGSYSLTARAYDNDESFTTSLPIGISVTAANQPPTASITSPANGASFPEGATVTVNATASDSDGTIASVRFYADGNLFASLIGVPPPYSAQTSSLAAGPHALTVVATDNGGLPTTSLPVNITITGGSGSTTVTLQDVAGGYAGTRDTYLDAYNVNHSWGSATRMLDLGTAYGDLVRFRVFASEGGPVPNGATITSATLSLYKQDAYDQSYQLRRVLKDWVESEATWNRARVGLSWTAPGANGVGSDITAAADASASIGWDPGWIAFNVTSAMQAMSGGASNFGWKLVPTGGTFGLKSYATRESASASFRPKLVVTYASGANTPPTVNITSPANGATFAAPANVTVTANASDIDGTIDRVEFFRNGAWVSTDTTAPYSATMALVPAGTHQLTAVTYDNGGASDTSPPISITVVAGTGGTVVLQDASGVYAGTRDTYLDSYNANHSWGSSTRMLDLGTAYGDLVRFAIFASEGGPVPNGATITSATLSLYKQDAYDQSYQLKRVLKDWVEGQATWNQARTGVAWTAGGASALGSDIAATADATGSVGWNPAWLALDVTSAVQAMSSGAANFGWKLVPTGGTFGLKSFATRETASPTLRPKLAITYVGGG